MRGSGHPESDGRDEPQVGPSTPSGVSSANDTFADAEISAAVAYAIKTREFAAVPGLIRLLALQNPAAAQSVLDAIELGSYLSGLVGGGQP
jgi:hypothetical protein